MSFLVAAAITGGAAVVGGVGGAMISSSASKNAAQMQAEAANHATDIQKQEFDQQQANQKPWLEAGQGALSKMQDPSFQHSFGMSDFQADPGYAFRMQQGQQAIERSAAARGGLQTAGTLKALSDYGQDSASQEYQNAYNRFTNDQSTRFNRLASVAGVGQTANAQLGQAGENYANNVGNIQMGAANAGGAASIAQGNMWGNTLSSLGSQGSSAVMQGQMLSKMFPQSPQPYTPMDYSNSETGYAAGPVNANGTYSSYQATMPALER